MWASRLTSTGARKYVSLLFMNLMASDGKETSLVPQAAFKPMRVKSLQDFYKLEEPIVCFSSKFLKIEKEVRFFLRSKMYNNKKVLLKNNHGKKIVNKLFYKIKNKPKKFLNADQLKNDPNRAIADFISGMTDRYAINLNKAI